MKQEIKLNRAVTTVTSANDIQNSLMQHWVKLRTATFLDWHVCVCGSECQELGVLNLKDYSSHRPEELVETIVPTVSGKG